ncbi:histidinol-phosphate transaminase [Chitinophaga nivalis]|uniref:Histidinol-phosphate aminotransferase n=1 Tax=Chitinophaga nivalis TaxID=2991709 RepID=A0ABT3IFJ3_9BACT|nr:histidinol-phosphate transaminase [Chitinophaga nivalis]MCW3467579.1 histidinol-phosphate transaminase [Chitinophaga nivalis]MCW3482729.1 histidinol-phosphate transaminase [Chitinophaga nivalis]
MFNLDTLLRDNIKRLVPYSTARDEFKGEAAIFLDANENSFGSPLPVNYNRYPDPLQWKIKYKLADIKGVPPQNIFIGNGSDEAIDLLYRAFCNPGVDNVVLCPPTYGMYEVSAHINDAVIRKVSLTPDFQLDIPALQQAIDEHTKLIFVCSPNNPTGNSIRKSDIELLLNNFNGIVVVDEAYINFARQKTFIQELTEYPNLVVLQTLSKAWGLAALRVGMAFAGEDIINVLNKVKPPYNISQATQELVLQALDNVGRVNEWIREIVIERDLLSAALEQLPQILEVYPSDANFVLVRTSDAKGIYQYLTTQGIVVRDRSRVELCMGCLRITVGTPEENLRLLEVLKSFNLKTEIPVSA